MTAAPLVFTPTAARRASTPGSPPRIPPSPAPRWKQHIETGRVLLNDAPVLKPNAALAPGDVLACTLPAPAPSASFPPTFPSTSSTKTPT
jgi:hypothetical protein